MPFEIERKFLVRHNLLKREDLGLGFVITQGYLSTQPVVRIRITELGHWPAGSKKAPIGACLTVKGAGLLKRFEAEYDIPLKDAKVMLKMCDRVISKTRYDCPWTRGQKISVDRFHGALHGLVLAEIELKKESSRFARPEWFGPEVTHDPRFANVSMLQDPKQTVVLAKRYLSES